MPCASRVSEIRRRAFGQVRIRELHYRRPSARCGGGGWGARRLGGGARRGRVALLGSAFDVRLIAPGENDETPRGRREGADDAE
jgi:hypothetical protein